MDLDLLVFGLDLVSTFAFALVGVLGAVAGSSALFTVAVGMALAAAFLNAAFNYCLGCEMYLLGLRFTSK